MSPIDPSAVPSSDRVSRRTTWGVLAFAILVSAIHQAGPVFKWKDWNPGWPKWNLWEWYIEDAAISFAYARNLYNGDGLVAFLGGERIEGYSNPLWVALMAVWHVIGIDGFASAKYMAMGFGAITVLITWRIAREVLGPDREVAALLAPVLLALFPQFAFWNASGLENPLFSLCLAGGIWQVLVEARGGSRFPWSAVFFLGLALTRPEAIMYAAWGGFVMMTLHLARGRGLRPTFAWLAVFFVPFVAYHAWRYNYFAWAFPNTYYAKQGDEAWRPYVWTNSGYRYIRNYFYDTRTGWFVPLYLIGLTGLRGWRAALAPTASLLLAVFVLYPDAPITGEDWKAWWPSGLEKPAWWDAFRAWGVLVVLLGLPFSMLGRPGSAGRVLAWGSCVITLFFALYSDGDWMKGFRWMSFLAVPASVLLAAGISELADLAQRVTKQREGNWGTPGWVVTALLIGALLPGWYKHSEWFFGKRETGPFSVHKRAQYTESLGKRLFLQDETVLNLDVDMGAHLFWSPHLMVDMAGLVDVSVAHHTYAQRPFTKEYIFEQRRPHIAHVHGGWATKSKIPTFNEWKDGYVEVHPFPAGSTTYHMGTHVRRDLILPKSWTGPKDRAVSLANGVMFAGYDVPSPEVSVGKSFYVEVGLQVANGEETGDVRILGFLAPAAGTEGPVQVFDLPAGYDWVPSSEWRADEVFVGKFALTLRNDLPVGTYDIGFVVLNADGEVLGPVSGSTLPVPAGLVVGTAADARVMVGELRFPNALTIGEAGTGEKAARLDIDEALDHAKSYACDAAEVSWRRARMHLPKAEGWRDEQRERVGNAIAGCWIGEAEDAGTVDEGAALLERARFWDRKHERLWVVADMVAQDLMKQGAEAMAAGDWARAYTAYDLAVRADPTKSWARRYAEEARDFRLKIDPEAVAKQKAEREARAAAKAREAAPAKPKAEGDEAPKEDAEPAKGKGAEAPAKPKAAKEPAKAAADEG